MTQEQKEALADRVVALLRDPDPRARLAALQARIRAGDAGPDGLDPALLALATALLEQLRR